MRQKACELNRVAQSLVGVNQQPLAGDRSAVPFGRRGSRGARSRDPGMLSITDPSFGVAAGQQQRRPQVELRQRELRVQLESPAKRRAGVVQSMQRSQDDAQVVEALRIVGLQRDGSLGLREPFVQASLAFEHECEATGGFGEFGSLGECCAIDVGRFVESLLSHQCGGQSHHHVETVRLLPERVLQHRDRFGVFVVPLEHASQLQVVGRFRGLDPQGAAQGDFRFGEATGRLQQAGQIGVGQVEVGIQVNCRAIGSDGRVDRAKHLIGHRQIVLDVGDVGAEPGRAGEDVNRLAQATELQQGGPVKIESVPLIGVGRQHLLIASDCRTQIDGAVASDGGQGPGSFRKVARKCRQAQTSILSRLGTASQRRQHDVRSGEVCGMMKRRAGPIERVRGDPQTRLLWSKRQSLEREDRCLASKVCQDERDPKLSVRNAPGSSLRAGRSGRRESCSSKPANIPGTTKLSAR